MSQDRSYPPVSEGHSYQPVTPVQPRGWTSHGYWYGPGESVKPSPTRRARCGGPGICKTCARDAGRLPRS